MPTQEQLIDAADVIATLARNIALKRALTEADDDPALNFWRMALGNSMDIAVLEWCKLFGNDDAAHQPTHWKNVIDAQDHATFRTDMLAHVGVSKTAWTDYWDLMKGYRDSHVAHLDAQRHRRVANYPELGTALSSATFYYQRVIAMLRGMGFDRYPNDLTVYYDAFQAQTLGIAKAAIAATNGFDEAVG
jgi:hypothetical protein